MPRDKAKKPTTNVESIKHKDKRKNIPTEELRDFVAADENAPKTMLYPRDPSLDPQLVWKGKDEQDQKDLAVPVVPIYIQEKIHPQVIIENLPRIDHSGGQLDLFADFNVLPTRMNPDLSMGEDLLKKTGAGNLFMVFGEPDVEIKKGKDGKITAEIKGLDVYDPTTGAIRSSSTDDIACWFIDTNYDQESFFVRHAYFTGSDEPYDKLKRALRADIDEAAWSELYSTTSRPFDPPQGKEGKPGKIAVKVINHYGDEVLKVYEVESRK